MKRKTGPPSKIDSLGVGPAVARMHLSGASHTDIADRVTAVVEGSISRDAVRRWLDSPAGVQATAQRREMAATRSVTTVTMDQGGHGFVASIASGVAKLLAICDDLSIDPKERVHAAEVAIQGAYLGAQLDEILTETTQHAEAMEAIGD